VTRVAKPETEEQLLAVARAGTAAHVERIVRGWRCMDRKAEAHETSRRHASRGLHVYYQDDDGMVVVRGRLEPEAGALVMQALTAAREMLYQRTRAREASGTVNAGNVSEATPTMIQHGQMARAAPYRGSGPQFYARSRVAYPGAGPRTPPAIRGGGPGMEWTDVNPWRASQTARSPHSCSHPDPEEAQNPFGIRGWEWA